MSREKPLPSLTISMYSLWLFSLVALGSYLKALKQPCSNSPCHCTSFANRSCATPMEGSICCPISRPRAASRRLIPPQPSILQVRYKVWGHYNANPHRPKHGNAEVPSRCESYVLSWLPKIYLTNPHVPVSSIDLHFVFLYCHAFQSASYYIPGSLRTYQLSIMVLFESICALKEKLSPKASINLRSDEAFAANEARWSDYKAPQPGAIVNVVTEGDTEKTVSSS